MATVKPVYVDTRCLFPSESFRKRHAENSGHEAKEDINVNNDAPIRYKGISLHDEEDDHYGFPLQYPAGKPLGEQSDETDDTQRYIQLYPIDSISDSDSMYSRRSTNDPNDSLRQSNDSGVFALDSQSDPVRKYERLSSSESNDSSTAPTSCIYNHLERETDDIDIDGGDTSVDVEPNTFSPPLKTKSKSSKFPPKRPKSPANTLVTNSNTLVTPRQSAIPWIPACMNATPTTNTTTTKNTTNTNNNSTTKNTTTTNNNTNNNSTTKNTTNIKESIRRCPKDPLPKTAKKSLSPPIERPPARRKNNPPPQLPSSPHHKPQRPTHAPGSIRSVHMRAPMSPTPPRCTASLAPHAWYHGIIDRVVAENRLCEHVALRRRNGNDVNGSWLLRAKPPPTHGEGEAYAISVAFRNRKEQRMMVEHHMIERAMRVDGTLGSHFLVNGQSHKLMKSKSILEIIRCLETNADFSEIVSTRPLVLLKYPCPCPGSTAY